MGCETAFIGKKEFFLGARGVKTAAKSLGANIMVLTMGWVHYAVIDSKKLARTRDTASLKKSSRLGGQRENQLFPVLPSDELLPPLLHPRLDFVENQLA